MARDHALAVRCEPDEGVVRFYRWDVATVSFGRNEPAVEPYAASRAGDQRFVRRPTGGRAVLHDRELTYAVIFPSRGLGSLRTAYEKINKGLLFGLRSLGVIEAQLEPNSAPVQKPDSGPCFGAPAPGEVVVEGRKLVGSAQARIEGTILQHGSLLLVSDQGGLNDQGGGGEATTLAEILGTVPRWSALVEALQGGLEDALGGVWVQGEYSPEELALAAEIEVRYRDDAWTWRS